ncbi:MAG: hypothetical protein DCE90_11920 [Pseudanabaena sp.]|nr:MAG: hypothetical protein DCE90_11920 [Pseudanabaena sp.]
MSNLPPNSSPLRSWLDRIGDRNPQLLREIRGKLRLRNLMVAIGISLLFQTLMLLFYSQRIPSDTCFIELRGLGCAESWSSWWLEQFRFITWTMPFILFLAGVYSLITDLSLEDYRGTLNFIRISPRASVNILMGKIIGVPLLAYIGLGLIFPYHLTTAIAGGVPISFLVSFYVLLIGTAFLLFSGAMLLALLNNWQVKLGGQVSAQALVASFISFVWIAPSFMWWNIFTVWSSYSNIFLGGEFVAIDAEWWYLPVTSNIWAAHIFAIGNLAIATLAIWRILQRRFHNPAATLVSKGQSYVMTIYIEFLMLGFCMQSSLMDSQLSFGNSSIPLILLLLITIANVVLFLGAIASLTPSRQAMLDWVRFGAISTADKPQNVRKYGLRYIIRDLIWSDKSPAPMAILLNLLFTQTPILIWINARFAAESIGRATLIVISFSLSIILIALIVQLGLFLKTRNPSIWVTGSVSGLIFLPLMLSFVLSIDPTRYAGWLLLGFPWLLNTEVNFSDIILGLCGQVFVAIALTFQLTYQLQRAKMRET